MSQQISPGAGTAPPANQARAGQQPPAGPRPQRLLALGLILTMLLVSAAEFPSQMRLLAQPGPGQPPTSKGELPQPLPAEIVKAWQEAGANVGWVRVNEYGFFEFVFEDAGKPGDVPTFHFAEWKAGVLGRLPPPAAGFGLSISGTKVTDAGLKELAGLTSLQTLVLNDTEVTDAGIAELRKALPDCRIIR